MSFSENTYRLIALLVFLPGIATSVYYRRRANQRGGSVSSKSEGPVFIVLRVLGLALWLPLLLYLVNPAWITWAQFPLPAWLRLVGAALAALCTPLIYWVFSSLGDNVTPTVATRQAHALVTSGPYRWVRHPLYSVGFLLFASFSLLSANWFTPIVLIPGMVALGTRTPHEEAQLLERFGAEYRTYMQRTGRYLPRLLGS